MNENKINGISMIPFGLLAGFADDKEIRNLRKALDILEHSDSEKTYLNNLQKSLFPYGCSENCYYR